MFWSHKSDTVVWIFAEAFHARNVGNGDFQLKNVDTKMKENKYTVTLFAIIIPD